MIYLVITASGSVHGLIYRQKVVSSVRYVQSTQSVSRYRRIFGLVPEYKLAMWVSRVIQREDFDLPIEQYCWKKARLVQK